MVCLYNLWAGSATLIIKCIIVSLVSFSDTWKSESCYLFFDSCYVGPVYIRWRVFEHSLIESCLGLPRDTRLCCYRRHAAALWDTDEKIFQKGVVKNYKILYSWSDLHSRREGLGIVQTNSMVMWLASLGERLNIPFTLVLARSYFEVLCTVPKISQTVYSNRNYNQHSKITRAGGNSF